MILSAMILDYRHFTTKIVIFDRCCWQKQPNKSGGPAGKSGAAANNKAVTANAKEPQ
jgi:hypothetical protein